MAPVGKERLDENVINKYTLVSHMRESAYLLLVTSGISQVQRFLVEEGKFCSFSSIFVYKALQMHALVS